MSPPRDLLYQTSGCSISHATATISRIISAAAAAAAADDDDGDADAAPRASGGSNEFLL